MAATPSTRRGVATHTTMREIFCITKHSISSSLMFATKWHRFAIKRRTCVSIALHHVALAKCTASPESIAHASRSLCATLLCPPSHGGTRVYPSNTQPSMHASMSACTHFHLGRVAMRSFEGSPSLVVLFAPATDTQDIYIHTMYIWQPMRGRGGTRRWPRDDAGGGSLPMMRSKKESILEKQSCMRSLNT